MNGFSEMAEGYRKAVAEGKLTQKEAEPEIRVYDFLGACTQKDIYRLADSTAFNEIMRAYCRKALQGAKVDEETQRAVMRELRLLFDEQTAEEVTTGKTGRRNIIVV